MKKSVLCFLCVTSLLFVPCFGKTKAKRVKKVDCTGILSNAIDLYNQKKYSKVTVKLESAKIQCSGSENMDSILYYLGMADLKSKKYTEARTEFETIVQNFQGSAFHEEAEFRIAHAVYLKSNPSARDQKETNEAILLLRDFIESYPNSTVADSAKKYLNASIEKLAEKDFNNAGIYVKLNQPESAVACYRSFLKDFPESKLSDQALLNIGEILIDLDRKSEALEALEIIIDHSSNQELIGKAKALVPKTK
jgi:outer membrane protein assembly factor BamD